MELLEFLLFFKWWFKIEGVLNLILLNLSLALKWIFPTPKDHYRNPEKLPSCNGTPLKLLYLILSP